MKYVHYDTFYTAEYNKLVLHNPRRNVKPTLSGCVRKNGTYVNRKR